MANGEIADSGDVNLGFKLLNHLRRYGVGTATSNPDAAT